MLAGQNSHEPAPILGQAISAWYFYLRSTGGQPYRRQGGNLPANAMTTNLVACHDNHLLQARK
jgi:hypothetical protein